MLDVLIGNTFVQFDWVVFQQTIGIQMGTNCAPLRVYVVDVQMLLQNKDKKKLAAQTFNSSFRYIDL